MKYYPVAVDYRIDTVKKIKRIKVNFKDNPFSISNMLQDEDEGYESEIVEKRNMPYQNNLWNAITYEISLNRMQFNRSVYRFVDLLGDLGGLLSALFFICMPLVYMLTYRGEN